MQHDNVLISESGDPLLCDFGVSRLLAASDTFSGAITSTTGGPHGTFRFMAREILCPTDEDSSVYSKQSDVWGFGMTVYVCNVY